MRSMLGSDRRVRGGWLGEKGRHDGERVERGRDQRAGFRGGWLAAVALLLVPVAGKAATEEYTPRIHPGAIEVRSAGGPLVLEGDIIRIVVDRNQMEASVDLVGEGSRRFSAAEGVQALAARASRPDLAPNAKLPNDTRLWAALQRASGGTWAGCVFDVEKIVATLEAGMKGKDGHAA